MFRTLAVLFISALLSVAATFAQQPPADQTNPTQAQPSTSPQPNPQTTPVQKPSEQAAPAQSHVTRLAPGSILPVQLTKTVDAKKAKTGDEVVAKVTGDLKNTSGVVIVPKDTKIVGHVTEAQARHKDQKESQLAIAFNEAVVNGETMQMPMSIQAIIAPPNQNQNQSAASAPSSGYPGGGMPSSGGSSSPGMPGHTASPQPSSGSEQVPEDAPQGNGTQAQAQPRPQITGETKGVIGISNLNLAPTPNAQQSSVLTSEKNNVKLEGGTMMLLRVSQ